MNKFFCNIDESINKSFFERVLGMIDLEALYPTHVVAKEILKRPVSAIHQGIHFGRIKKPATKLGTAYLFSVAEIRQVAITLGCVDTFRDYFREDNAALRAEQGVTVGR